MDSGEAVIRSHLDWSIPIGIPASVTSCMKLSLTHCPVPDALSEAFHPLQQAHSPSIIPGVYLAASLSSSRTVSLRIPNTSN